MDRRDHLDDVFADADDAAGTDEPTTRSARSPHPTWVRAVTIGLIVLFVLATIVGALL